MCVLHHFSSPTRWNGSRGLVRPETGPKHQQTETKMFSFPRCLTATKHISWCIPEGVLKVPTTGLRDVFSRRTPLALFKTRYRPDSIPASWCDFYVPPQLRLSRNTERPVRNRSESVCASLWAPPWAFVAWLRPVRVRFGLQFCDSRPDSYKFSGPFQLSRAQYPACMPDSSKFSGPFEFSRVEYPACIAGRISKSLRGPLSSAESTRLTSPQTLRSVHSHEIPL
jgi:hypothetical protein